MGEEFLSLFLQALSAPDTPFQSIVVTTQLEDAVWGGWRVMRLNRPRFFSTGEPVTDIFVGDVHRAANGAYRD